MSEVVIAGAARTPIGSLNGALSSFPAHRLGQIVIAEALRRCRVDAQQVSEVISEVLSQAGDSCFDARGSTPLHEPIAQRRFSY